MAILVTGGAGYIGSAFVEALVAAGQRVVVLDDLSRGHRAAVHPDAVFQQGRTGDRALVARVVSEHRVEACVHFAAFAYVGESVKEPARYFDNNFTQAQALFDALLAAGVKRVVFSSTCATYGVPTAVPIAESHPQWPIKPLRLVEAVRRAGCSRATTSAHDLRFVALRYFNAAGATTRVGEHHDPETHLIPLALRAATGGAPALTVFGSDYDTPDGTRDPRLHPRRRPRRGAPAGARASPARRRLAVPEPRHRYGLLGARGDRDGAPRVGPGRSAHDRPAPRGRPAAPRGRRLARPRGARLDPEAAGAGSDRPLGLGLDADAPERLPGLTPRARRGRRRRGRHR
jgi:hypothetical protein